MAEDQRSFQKEAHPRTTSQLLYRGPVGEGLQGLERDIVRTCVKRE